jgi:potassium-transporting ATPase potassium-binding subunit
MINDLTQFTLYVLILIVLIVPMGMWLARTFSSPSHSTPERLTYKVLGIDPEEKMSWKRYGVVLLLSNAAMMGLGYLLLRIRRTNKSVRRGHNGWNNWLSQRDA